MTEKRKKSLLLIVGILAGLFLFISKFGGWDGFKTSLISKAGQTAISLSSNKDFLNNVLGFDHRKQYIFVLLDNQKLTSFGGTPTMYSVINVENGIFSVSEFNLIDAEDVEFISNQKVDLNFEEVSKKFAEFYGDKSENSENAKAVIGFTYSSLEDILKLVGEFEFKHKQFSHQNTAELVAEIANSQSDFGIKQNQQVSGFLELVMGQAKEGFFKHRRDYVKTLKNIFVEEKAFIYHFDSGIYNKLISEGLVKTTENYQNDIIGLVENEISSAEVNRLVNRELNYQISKGSDDLSKGNLSLVYKYQKVEDISQSYISKINLSVKIDGLPMDKDFDLELLPGEEKELKMEFDLSSSIESSLKAGKYLVLLNKQLGEDDLDFSIDFDLKKDLESCTPFEEVYSSSKTRCILKTKIKSDSEFSFIYNQ